MKLHKHQLLTFKFNQYFDQLRWRKKSLKTMENNGKSMF